MNWKQSWVAAALAVAAIGAQPASAQMAEAVAAIVNDNLISTFDVRQRANLILLSAGVRSTPEIQQRARAQALRDLVDERLQLQEAKKFDINVSASDIDSRIRQIAQANETTPEAFLRNMSSAGVGPATLRQQIEADVAWQRLMSGMFRTRVRISQVEVRETQARIASNSSRPQYLISEIFLPAESEAELDRSANWSAAPAGADAARRAFPTDCASILGRAIRCGRRRFGLACSDRTAL